HAEPPAAAPRARFLAAGSGSLPALDARPPAADRRANLLPPVVVQQRTLHRNSRLRSVHARGFRAESRAARAGCLRGCAQERARSPLAAEPSSGWPAARTASLGGCPLLPVQAAPAVWRIRPCPRRSRPAAGRNRPS